MSVLPQQGSGWSTNSPCQVCDRLATDRGATLWAIVHRRNVMPTTHPSAPSVRPLRAGEVGPLIEVFDRLSAQSRFLRFNAPLPRLTALMVEQLTAQE